MRIDIVQPQPIPEIPRVSESNASSSMDGNYSRQMRKSASVSDETRLKKPGGDKLDDQIEQINEKLKRSGKKIQFKIHQDPNAVIVQVVNSDTNEVVQEIPSEKMLEIISNMQKLYGQSMDKKV